MDNGLTWHSILDRRSSEVGAAEVVAVAAGSGLAAVFLMLSQRRQQRPSAPQGGG